jgi:formylglycine-generating enzyme required for sulfatase activity
MIEVPAGTFVIGSPAAEPERHAIEGPQKRLTIAAFGVSKTEITRGQYAAFVRDTRRPDRAGCDTQGDAVDVKSDADEQASWRNPRFEQTDEHPVVCVSWQDASDYAAWLTRKTGHRYRLLSEAEWEYAARAGTTTAYFWGDDADRGCVSMNGGDPSLARALPQWQEAIRKDRAAGFAGARLLACDDQSAFTAAAGSYRPNAFGLHDVSGNVWEWVEDCYENSYASLTTDGRARTAQACTNSVIRGGSWDDYPQELRSADRHYNSPQTRRNDLGLRVARELSKRD